MARSPSRANGRGVGKGNGETEIPKVLVLEEVDGEHGHDARDKDQDCEGIHDRDGCCTRADVSCAAYPPMDIYARLVAEPSG